MAIIRGSVVESLNGRDKGNLLVVLEVKGDSLLLADGKRRTLESPKLKKQKHIKAMGETDLNNLRTNLRIKKMLRQIDFTPMIHLN